MTPPKYLGKIGRTKWRELVKQLGTIQPNEADALGLLCGSWETYLAAYADVQATGTVIKSERNGRLFVNPNVNVLNEAFKQIKVLSKSFGLSPERVAEQASSSDDDEMMGLIEGK